MNIRVYGDFQGVNGHASANRSFINGMQFLGHEIDMFELTVSGRRLGDTQALISRPQDTDIPDARVFFGSPAHVDEVEKVGENVEDVILYSAHEADKIPEDWHDGLERCKGIITPSTYCQDVFESEGYDAHVVGRGINTRQFTRDRMPYRGFKFLVVAEWTPRKNLRQIIRTFSQEFVGEPVRLLVKTWSNSGIKPETLQEVIDYENTEDAAVKQVAGNYDDAEMPQLYNNSDVLIIGSHGEGFCSPGLEALACGVPVISPDYGGQTDYLNEDNAWLIDYEEIPCPEYWNYTSDMSWCNPDPDALLEAMRDAYTNPEKVQEKSDNAMRSVVDWKEPIKTDELVKTVQEIEGL